jgi:TIR domain
MTTIFISHIHEEAELALLLKNWIEDTFLGQIEVFVSADDRDIVIGDEWFNRISQALDTAKVVLLLCSPESIKRPWISFEAGWAWSKRIALAPICHSGLLIGDLPRPLSNRQAVVLQESDALSRLIRAIGQHHGITKFPRIADTNFQTELSELLAIKQITKDVATHKTQPSKNAEFFEERNRILQLLEKSPRSLTSENISHSTGISHSIVKLLASRLDAEDLIWSSLTIGGPTSYGISDKGREHLLECGLLN